MSRLTILLLFSFLPLSVSAGDSAIGRCNLSGRVVSVADGDTVTVLDANNVQHKIRLAGIDAPERGQPYSNVAKRALSDWVFNKDVCVDWFKKDRYRRKIGTIYVDEYNINYSMVVFGLAWHYKQFQKEQTNIDRVSFSDAEAKARSGVIGLWKEPNPVPPWEWRKNKRPKNKTKKNKTVIFSTSAGKDKNKHFHCGSKRFCSDMVSCAEARFYLHTCGLTRLDGDSDGVPCETVHCQ